jgi:hypothetical protein
MAEPERRSHKRARVDYPVRVRAASGEEFDGTVDNLGELGALVATRNLEVTFDVGDVLTLRIDTGKGTVEAEGQVLRIEQEFAEGDVGRSFAVRFSRPLKLPK